MTAPHSPTVRIPARSLVRAFWVLHRTLHRLSGGTFGLSRPREHKRFGMLRLDTVGRRTGEPRRVILGYFEDGPNLVTIAMNGWADTEPAWWLNLQAAPDATVRLPDGIRPVRARPAMGDERDRLWAVADRYPGWGQDLTALAASRSLETAVVVFQPRVRP